MSVRRTSYRPSKWISMQRAALAVSGFVRIRALRAHFVTSSDRPGGRLVARERGNAWQRDSFGWGECRARRFRGARADPVLGRGRLQLAQSDPQSLMARSQIRVLAWQPMMRPQLPSAAPRLGRAMCVPAPPRQDKHVNVVRHAPPTSGNTEAHTHVARVVVANSRAPNLQRWGAPVGQPLPLLWKVDWGVAGERPAVRSDGAEMGGFGRGRAQGFSFNKTRWWHRVSSKSVAERSFPRFRTWGLSRRPPDRPFEDTQESFPRTSFQACVTL